MKPLVIYNKLQKLPFGNYIFSKLVCFNAPYFSSISPLITHYEKGRCEVFLKKRRAVTNHIKTVHAIAMCNLAELAAGICLEGTIPNNLRWIPKGMEVKYLKKASTNLIAKVEIEQEAIQPGDLHMEVMVTDKDNVLVFSANINMYVSARSS